VAKELEGKRRRRNNRVSFVTRKKERRLEAGVTNRMRREAVGQLESTRRGEWKLEIR